MSKYIPISVRIPEVVLELAEQAPLNCSSTAEKLNLLLEHFLDNNLPTPNMERYLTNSPTKTFTLRLKPTVVKTLDKFCSKTLYTRQQTIQIAICASLIDLQLLT